MKQDRKSYQAAYNLKNHERLKASKRANYAANRQRYLAQKKKYRLDNLEKVKSKDSNYYRKNKSKIIKRILAWEKVKLKTDPQFRLRKNLRKRVWEVLRSQSAIKKNKTITLVGCSVKQLMTHLESQFQVGMSWANYGAWHVDHIKPCASFDLTNPQQQHECFHFTNLQPLWAKDNLSKGDS